MTKQKGKQKTRKESKCWISNNAGRISPFQGPGTWGTEHKASKRWGVGTQMKIQEP